MQTDRELLKAMGFPDWAIHDLDRIAASEKTTAIEIVRTAVMEKLSKRRVTTQHQPNTTAAPIAEAFDRLRGYFAALSYESGSSTTSKRIVQWLYAATKAWLNAGCSRESLAPQLPALDSILRKFVKEALDFATEDIAEARLELAGKVKASTGCAAEIVAAEPALRRLTSWFIEQAP